LCFFAHQKKEWKAKGGKFREDAKEHLEHQQRKVINEKGGVPCFGAPETDLKFDSRWVREVLQKWATNGKDEKALP